MVQFAKCNFFLALDVHRWYNFGVFIPILLDDFFLYSGYQHQGSTAKRPKTEAEVKCESLTVALQQASEENLRLTNRVKQLELRVAQLEGTSVKAKTLSDAILIDSVVNG